LFGGADAAPAVALGARSGYSRLCFGDYAELKEMFRSPYEDSDFVGVNEIKGVLWACGSKRVEPSTARPYGRRPYVVRSTGGDWEEMEAPSLVEGPAFSEVFPVAADFCWFQSGDAVYTYNGGAWTRVLNKPGADVFLFTVTGRGRAYVYVYYPGSGRPELYVSDDRGRSWVVETPAVENSLYNSAYPGRVAVIAAAGESLFIGASFNAKFSRHEVLYEGIMGRDEAPPGEGTYRIEFMAPYGPYFVGIGAMAFLSEIRGYAIGSGTSVAVDDGEWILEANSEEYWRPLAYVIAAGNSGYWTVGRAPDSDGGYSLYYAPLW
jgi:hypothetical protein